MLVTGRLEGEHEPVERGDTYLRPPLDRPRGGDRPPLFGRDTNDPALGSDTRWERHPLLSDHASAPDRRLMSHPEGGGDDHPEEHAREHGHSHQRPRRDGDASRAVVEEPPTEQQEEEPQR